MSFALVVLADVYVCMYIHVSLQPSMQTLQDTAQLAAEQLQPDETTLQSGFVMDISKGSLSMEAPGLGVCWGWRSVCVWL